MFGSGGLSGIFNPQTMSQVGQGLSIYNQANTAFGGNQQRPMPSVGASAQPGGQIQPIDYMSLLNPQQQTVIRPATPSLI